MFSCAGTRACLKRQWSYGHCFYVGRTQSNGGNVTRLSPARNWHSF